MRVERTRSGRPESTHRVHVAVVRADGSVVASDGAIDDAFWWRSAAKPFQAIALVADGGAERFALTTEELALTCASHSSEPHQVELVRAFLAKIGCTERDLACGPHPPLSDAVARDYQRQGITLSAIHSNCSGKHAGMLALAKHHRWPTAGYHRLEHPVQQRLLTEVSTRTGVRLEEIGTGVDGCGVVCYAIPIRQMAWAYAMLGSTEPGAGLSRKELLPAPCSELRNAMLTHPDLIAGAGRPCTEMMVTHAGKVVVKVGAEGVYCAALVEQGIGVALKVDDGNAGAAAVAMAWALNELGLRMPDALLVKPVINTRGEQVGEMRVLGGWRQENDTAGRGREA